MVYRIFGVTAEYPGTQSTLLKKGDYAVRSE